MKSLPNLLATMMAITLLIGCEQQARQTSSPSGVGENSTEAVETHTHADGSAHAAHANDDAAHSHWHAHGGEITALGEKQVLGYVVTASREGGVAAGQEAVFLIVTAPAAEAVRLWVGDEQATNAPRSKAEGGPTSFHAHAMVPESFTDDSKLWVEVQNASGERGSVAFDLTVTATGSHSHDGETHSHDDQSHSHGEPAHSH